MDEWAQFPDAPSAAASDEWDQFPDAPAATGASGFSPENPRNPTAKIAPPLAGAGENGEDLQWYDAPAPTAAEPEMDPDTRRNLLRGKAIAKGATSIVTGVPDLVVSTPILGRNLISDEHKWSDDLFPITNTVFDAAGKASDALGIPNVQPETLPEKLESNVLEFGTGALSPSGWLRGGAKLAPKIAPALERIAPEIANKLAKPAENFPRLFSDITNQAEATSRAASNPSTVGAVMDFLKPTAAKAVAGAGAGTGFTAAEEVAPDSPLAALFAAALGAGAAPTAAKIAMSPIKTAGNISRNMSVDPRFAGKGPFELPPNADTVDRAANVYQSFASDKDAALKNLDAAATDFGGDAVQNTTGRLADDVGLLRLERGMRQSKDPRLGNEFINRDRDLAQQNVKDFQKLSPTEVGNKQATADEIAGQVDNTRTEQGQMVTGAEQELRRAAAAAEELKGTANAGKQKYMAGKEANLDEANANAEGQTVANQSTARDIANEPRMGQEQASKSLVEDVIQPAKEAKRNEYKAMIAPFEKDANTPIDTSLAHKAVNSVAEDVAAGVDLGPEKGVIEWASKKLKRTGNTGINAQANLSTPQSNPAELLNIEQRLNQASRDAKAAGRGASVQAINSLRQGLNDVFDNAGVSEEFRNARAFYKENIAEPFIHGTTGKVLKAGSKGEEFALPTGEAITKYFQPGPKGGASMDQLTKIGGDKAKALVQDHVVSDVIDKYYNSAKDTIDASGIRKYVTAHKEAFDRVPEIRQEIFGIVNKVESGQSLAAQAGSAAKGAKEDLRNAKITGDKYVKSRESALQKTVDVMHGKVSQVRKQADETVKAEERSAARYYLGDADPDVAIKRAFENTNNLTRDLSELQKRVTKDTTGKAASGLKESVYDYLEGSVSTTNKALAKGENSISAAKLESIKKYQSALEKSGIYSAEDIKVLDTVRKRMEVSQRGELKVTAGSDTAENIGMSDSQKAIARSSLRAVFGGFEGGNKYSILRDTLSLLTGAERKSKAVAAVAQRAMLDPELGKILLKRDLSRLEETTFRTKLNRIFTNRNVLAVTESQQGEE